jgi:membrane protein DedA with SNARE-associated domain
VLDLTTTALEFVRLYGPLALCLFVFLETSMLFPFLPSEVVVPAAAVLLVTDVASLVVFVVAGGVGGTLGAFVPFAVGAESRFGDSDWLRRHLQVSADRVEQARTWFRRWGQWSVLWGRFLPVLRSVVSLPAGFAGMDPVRFGVFTAVGTVGFYAATGGLVYYGRQESLFAALVAFAADRPALSATVLLALLGSGLLVGRWQSTRQGN